MPRVLVVCYPWLPAFNGTVKHAALLVRHLPEAGWDPIVLTADWDAEAHAPAAGMALAWPATDDVPAVRGAGGVTVVRAPFVPLDNRWLRWRAADRAREGGEAPLHPRRAVRRAVEAAYPLYGDYPDEARGWVVPAVAAGMAAVRQLGIGAVVSLSLPDSAHVAAGEIARAAGVPWVPIFRGVGSFRADHVAGSSLVSRLQRRAVARRWLRGASRAVASSPAMAGHLARYLCVPCDLAMAPLDPEERRLPPRRVPDAPLRVVHLGAFSPALPGVDVLLDALDTLLASEASLAARLRVEFVGCQCDTALLGRLAGRRAAAVCTVVPCISPAEAVVCQREADVLLTFATDDPLASDASALAERLNARRPVIALGPAGTDLARLLAETKSGEVVEGAPALAAWIRATLDVLGDRGEVPYAGDESALTRFGAPELARRIGAILDVASAERFGRWQRG